LRQALNVALSNFAANSRTRKVLVSLCVLLIFASAAVQALHLHPAGQVNELKECPVCQVVALTAVAVLVLLFFVIIRSITYASLLEDVGISAVFCSPELFSRPPPAA
jgi:hypothetical protein